MGTQPVGGGYTPAVAWDETGEPILRHWGAEVVADASLVIEELPGHHGAHSVAAAVLGAGLARSIPIEAGDGIDSARLQVGSKGIELAHGDSMAIRRSMGIADPRRRFGSPTQQREAMK